MVLLVTGAVPPVLSGPTTDKFPKGGSTPVLSGVEVRKGFPVLRALAVNIGSPLPVAVGPAVSRLGGKL